LKILLRMTDSSDVNGAILLQRGVRINANPGSIGDKAVAAPSS
jgi:hypothetical protein